MNIASWPNSVICKTWPMVTWLACEILFLMKFWQTIQLEKSLSVFIIHKAVHTLGWKGSGFDKTCSCSAKAADAHSQLSGTDERLHKQSAVEWRELGNEIPLPLRSPFQCISYHRHRRTLLRWALVHLMLLQLILYKHTQIWRGETLINITPL